MGKTVVLFGAGAEVGFNISGGDEFARNVLGLRKEEENEASIDCALKNVYDNKYKKLINSQQEWYPSKFQIVSFTEKELQRKLFYACYRKKALDEQRHSQVLTDDRINEELDTHSQQKRSEVISEVINSHTSYMGIVDGYFHTLISPNLLGPQKFCTVMAFYTRAYLCIAKKILEKDDSPIMSYQQILEEPAVALSKMKSIIKKHRDFNEKDSYYSILKKISSTNKDNYSIITTNYTPCCEIVSDINKDRIAFVHGRFGLFESPYNLQVVDVEKDQNYPYDSNILFPYIFIQSGIKPIVEKNQLIEYSKALSFIASANRVVIVGYRINADDNHLNSLIRDAIIDEKEIVYLDYDNVGEDVILKRLRLQSTEKRNFIYEHIKKETAFDVFQRWMQ